MSAARLQDVLFKVSKVDDEANSEETVLTMSSTVQANLISINSIIPKPRSQKINRIARAITSSGHSFAQKRLCDRDIDTWH